MTKSADTNMSSFDVAEEKTLDLPIHLETGKENQPDESESLAANANLLLTLDLLTKWVY